MATLIEVEVGLGDVVEVLRNRVEVVELYTTEAGTPFFVGEDVEGNTVRMPTRLAEVLWSQKHDGGEEVEAEVETAPGVWVSEEDLLGPSSDDVKPRNIWTAEEVA